MIQMTNNEGSYEFTRKNVITFIIGFLTLVIGFFAMGTGSITLSPIMIIAGYIIIGISLVI